VEPPVRLPVTGKNVDRSWLGALDARTLTAGHDRLTDIGCDCWSCEGPQLAPFPGGAEAIARRVGILTDATAPRIVTGTELDGIDDATLRALLAEPVDLLFARVKPEHKMRVVAAFKDLGEVVAVTGDGANDAPALKRADIGVAMASPAPTWPAKRP
jgi:hypothetical protein